MRGEERGGGRQAGRRNAQACLDSTDQRLPRQRPAANGSACIDECGGRPERQLSTEIEHCGWLEREQETPRHPQRSASSAGPPGSKTRGCSKREHQRAAKRKTETGKARVRDRAQQGEPESAGARIHAEPDGWRPAQHPASDAIGHAEDQTEMQARDREQMSDAQGRERGPLVPQARAVAQRESAEECTPGTASRQGLQCTTPMFGE